MNRSRFLLSLMAGLALGIFGTASLGAQVAPAANGVSAHMVVTQEARQGSDEPVISLEDVAVYEGAQRDYITGWVPAQGAHAELEFFILLDDSSTTTLGSQLGDIRQFINAQPSSTKIGVAYMRNGIARIEQPLTSDHALAAKALRLPLGSGGANGSPYFSLSDLVKHWPKSDSRREVLMVSDGADPYYNQADLLDPYLATAIRDTQRAGVVVSVIYNPGATQYGAWRTFMGQTYLAQVAKETGGAAYYIGFNGPAVAFAPYLHDLANRLNHQYLLSFVAGPTEKAGLQSVKLTTEAPGADLVSADRVYVPEGR